MSPTVHFIKKKICLQHWWVISAAGFSLENELSTVSTPLQSFAFPQDARCSRIHIHLENINGNAHAFFVFIDEENNVRKLVLYNKTLENTSHTEINHTTQDLLNFWITLDICSLTYQNTRLLNIIDAYFVNVLLNADTFYWRRFTQGNRPASLKNHTNPSPSAPWALGEGFVHLYTFHERTASKSSSDVDFNNLFWRGLS